MVWFRAGGGSQPWPLDNEVDIMMEAGDRVERERKLKASLWRIRRVKRRIEKGYYSRPEVRKDIVDALLDAFLGNGKRRVP